MSHMTKVDVKIKDIGCLMEACKELGVAYDADATKAIYWNGSTVDCDAVIRVDGCTHEIAVKKEADGSHTLHADFYGTPGSQLSAKVGRNCGLLIQSYTIAKAKSVARKKGYSVSEKKLDGGKRQLALRRY